MATFLGVLLFFAIIVIVGEWWEIRKKTRKPTAMEAMSSLERQVTRQHDEIRELKCQMEALLWHLKLEPVRRSWEPYYEMVEKKDG